MYNVLLLALQEYLSTTLVCLMQIFGLEREKREMGQETEKPSTSGLTWAIVYGATSIAITLFNKAVMSTYDFHFSALLTMCQNIVTLGFMLVLKRFGVIYFPEIDMQVAKKVFPLSLVSLFYIIVSLSALGGINLPMFTALRRTTVLFVMVEEYFLMGTVPSRRVCYTVGIMTIGAIIAASKDLTFEPYAYFLVILTNLATSLYTVKIAQVKRETPSLTIFAMLYYNTVLTLPVVALFTILNGDIFEALKHPAATDPLFQLCFLASCSLAFIMNLATYFSSSLNGPTTQSVVGQLKNFLAFVLGLAMFSDYVFHPVNFTGLLIGFSGGLLYSWVTMKEKEQQKYEKVPSNDEEDGPNRPNVKDEDA